MLEADDITVLRGRQVAQAGEKVLEEFEEQELEMSLRGAVDEFELEKLEKLELAVRLLQPDH